MFILDEGLGKRGSKNRGKVNSKYPEGERVDNTMVKTIEILEINFPFK